MNTNQNPFDCGMHILGGFNRHQLKLSEKEKEILNNTIQTTKKYDYTAILTTLLSTQKGYIDELITTHKFKIISKYNNKYNQDKNPIHILIYINPKYKKINKEFCYPNVFNIFNN